MRMLIVGAGSTGGYFGGRLAQAGRDVTFLVRPARAERLRAAGLEVISPHGGFTLQPQLVTAGELATPFDAVLLTVKAFSLDAAMGDLAPVVGPATMILPVLNGMRHMDLLAARFGKDAVMGCACKVATMLDGQGRIVQLSPLQELAYGELDGVRSGRAGKLDAFIRGAGFDAKLSPAIAREMWEKWVLLATLGGINSLLRGSIGEIEKAGGAGLALQLLAECAAVSTASGHPPSEAFLASAAAAMTAKGSPLTSSMYRDLQAGMPVEADQILGDLLVRANALGVSAPLLTAASTHLTVYQNRLPPA